MKEVQLGFDYAALDTETRAFVQERAAKIHHLARMTAAGIVQIGQHLTEVKARLKHGQFLEWIRREFAWADRHAQRFMGVYQRIKSDKLSDLETDSLEIDVSALYLIAAPKTPEPVRQEAVKMALSGERVTHGAVKAVIAEYNKTGDVDAAVGQIFRAVTEARKEAAAALPSPAEARARAIASGAHTLDRNGIYQPPVTVEQQAQARADMARTDGAFRFCRWVSVDCISPEDAARIIKQRQWKDYYRNIPRAIQWLQDLQEQLQCDGRK